MKEFIKSKLAVIIGLVNVVLCLEVGLLVGGDNLGVRGGMAFLCGFAAMLFEWLLFRKADGNVPAAAVVGLLIGTALACYVC